MMIASAVKLPKVLPPIHANAGAEAMYRKRLRKLIREMAGSVRYWVEAAYKANEPEIAADELPATALRRAVRRLARRWQKEFDEAAPRLAEHFAKSANRRTAASLEKILRDGGLSVEFRMTRAARDVMSASIAEQVALIRSIPQRYFAEVEGHVMRSVQAGRDLAPLSRKLADAYGVTRRRAALIARDQNNKATAAMVRVRQQELGVKEAVWVHSGGGKEPRPTHLAAGVRRQRYDVTKGWFDPDAHGKGKGDWVFPGELINCRCVARAVVPGFS